MALTSYSTLKTAIANWLNRSDLTSEIAEDFIVLTESDFNNKLRIRKMITQTTLNVDQEAIDLPTGFLQVRDVYIKSGATKYSLQRLHTWIRSRELQQPELRSSLPSWEKHSDFHQDRTPDILALLIIIKPLTLYPATTQRIIF